jgi:hypothetical protein
MFDDLVVASLTARVLPPSHDVALRTSAPRIALALR